MIALALYVALTQQPEIPRQQKGITLYEHCKGAIRFLDSPIGAIAEEESSNFDNCFSYIEGFLDGDLLRTICPPDEASLGTAIRIYVSYMDKNPKLLDTYKGVGLALSLKQAYPCKTRRK